MSAELETCNLHPSRDLEWDGYGMVCPGCVLGHPVEEQTEEFGEDTETMKSLLGKLKGL